MPELTAADIRKTMADFSRRCDAARNAGGIALVDVEDGRAKVPHGWILDWQTDYFIPPDVKLL